MILNTALVFIHQLSLSSKHKTHFQQKEFNACYLLISDIISIFNIRIIHLTSSKHARVFHTIYSQLCVFQVLIEFKQK